MMSSLGNVTATAGVLDALSTFANDLRALEANPESFVAMTQLNADFQNLGAAATSILPGIGAVTAFVAISADLTMMGAKIANGILPSESDFLGVAGNLVTIAGQVVIAAGLAETSVTGGLAAVPGLATVTVGEALDGLSATIVARSVGIDYSDIQSNLSSFSSALGSLATGRIQPVVATLVC